MRHLSQILIILTMPAALAAQALGPVAGGWGAEARTDNGGALLRFRSEASAIVLGITANFAHDAAFSSGDQTRIGARLGTRRYARLAEKTRPYRTMSVLVNYEKFSTFTLTELGVGLEMGVAHFFTQHISVGASGELSATVSSDKSTLSGAPNSSGYAVGFSGFRVFGGVYF